MEEVFHLFECCDRYFRCLVDVYKEICDQGQPVIGFNLRLFEKVDAKPQVESV